MKKILLIICLFVFGSYEVDAQIGCAVGNTLYTSKQGSKYKKTPNQTISLPCYFVYTPPGNRPCRVKTKPETTGILVDAIECPIDDSYGFMIVGMVITLVSFRKIKFLA